jgi:reactive intermediate/imine deaminase
MRYPFRRWRYFALCFLLTAGVTQLLSQTGGVIKVIQVGSKNAGSASSAGILVNRTLYVSGQDGRNSSGEVPKDFQNEVRQSLSNVQGVLRAAGMDFGNVVWMNIYMTHLSDMDGMNMVYWKMIGADAPARTVLGVASLPHGENIEINCIAVSSAARRRVIHPQGWPEGKDIDPAGIEADDVLYMSAQGGVDPLTGKAAADDAGEVKQALDNVAAVAKAANMSMANVIWVNPYLSSNGGTEHVMNKIYASYFEFGNTPGRGTIQVVELPHQAHVVFSCIAGADLSKRISIRPRNEKPSPTASPGILYGDTLYLSAKDAYVPALGLFSPELGIQVRMSMRSLLDGLQKADMDFSNVVSSTIYLRDAKDDDPVVSLYGTFFKDNYPARTTLQQNFDTKSEDVEQISFVAVRQPLH